jgi:hypothetical protein
MNYNEKVALDTWSKQTQTKPNLSAYMAGKFALSAAEGPILKRTTHRMDCKLQGVCCDIDDFLDDVSVTLLIFRYFCEDVFNLLLFHIRRFCNLDVDVSGGQLEVFHHFKLADDFLFILVSNLGHAVQ